MALYCSRRPTQNAFVESLNGRFRDECLNEHMFRNCLPPSGSSKIGGSIITRTDLTPASAASRPKPSREDTKGPDAEQSLVMNEGIKGARSHPIASAVAENQGVGGFDALDKLRRAPTSRETRRNDRA